MEELKHSPATTSAQAESTGEAHLLHPAAVLPIEWGRPDSAGPLWSTASGFTLSWQSDPHQKDKIMSLKSKYFFLDR